MSLGEVILAALELSLGGSAIKLIIKQELLVFFEPLGADEEGRCADLLIRRQLILLSQLSVHFELFEEIFQVLCALDCWFDGLVRVGSTKVPQRAQRLAIDASSVCPNNSSGCCRVIIHLVVRSAAGL